MVAGSLEQFLADECPLSGDCVKALLRNCRGLHLIDLRTSDQDLTVDDAEEIVTLFGRFGRVERLTARTHCLIWRNERVAAAQTSIADGEMNHRGRFVIDCRLVQPDGFVNAEDDSVTDPNALVVEDDEEDLMMMLHEQYDYGWYDEGEEQDEYDDYDEEDDVYYNPYE